MSGGWGSLILISLSVLLAACSPGLAAVQTTIASDSDFWLSADQPIGQSFVATRSELEGVAIWLRPDGDATGEIVLRLLSDAGATEELVTARVPLSALQERGYQRFEFPPQTGSAGRYYYLALELAGAGRVGVGTGPVDIYSDGVLYQGGRPAEGQLALQLVFGSASLLIWLLRATLFGVGLAAGFFLVYVVPGWSMLAWLWPGPPLTWPEVLIGGAGLTLAIYPLLLLWTDLVGWHWGAGYAWILVMVGLAVLIARYGLHRPALPALGSVVRVVFSSPNGWPYLTLIALATLLVAGRLLMVRQLEMPLGGDAVQHTVIVQRMLEAGGLFTSWAPYAEARTLTTQFGYHAIVAAWSWITGMEAPQAVLWTGQMLNVLAVLALYPLGYRLKGAWAGIGAVLVAGFLTQFPNFYTNWGRYPQMAGQILLPIAAWWLWIMLQTSSPRRGLLFVGGAGVVAGMVLTYYRMAFHYAAFVLAALVLLRPLAAFVRRQGMSFGAMALLTGFLIAPWYLAIFSGHPGSGEGGGAVAPADVILEWQNLQVHSLIEVGVIVASAVAAWWGGRALALPVLWWWALIALPLLRLIGIPGSEIIQSFTIETSQYIPFALGAGCVAGYIVEQWWSNLPRWRRPLAVSLSVVCLGLGTLRMPALITSLNLYFNLSTRPDLRASNWIRHNLPADAIFLINGTAHSDGRSVVATDAGTWLPLLTKRGITIPPQYALLAEKPSLPGYNAAVNQLVMQLLAVGTNSTEGHAAVCAFPRPITHAYIGQHRGGVMGGVTLEKRPPVLRPAELLQDSAFRLVYAEDRVMIFEFNRLVCAK